MFLDVLELQQDPDAFRDEISIMTDEGQSPLGDCIESWQYKDFISLDAGWQAAVGQSPSGRPIFSRGWLERPRGHSKTSDIAASVTWALFASRRSIRGVVCAADKEQARLLLDAVERLLFANPWLGQVLKITNFKVTNRATGSQLEVIAADAASSYGLLIDFAVMDEVCHWQKRDLFDSIFSSVAKKRNTMLLIISNAGFTDSWQYEVRENVRQSDQWYFSRLEGPRASWISDELLAEQESLLPPTAFRRLWHNEWSTGAGDAIDRELIDVSFKESILPMRRAQEGWAYVAGVDLGVSRDASAIVVLAVKQASPFDYNPADIGRIRLVFTRKILPRRGERVDLQTIENDLLTLHRRFQLKAVVYDPWQCEHIAQRLMMSRVPMEALAPSGSNLQAVASAVLECFNDRRLDLYEDEDLRRDLYRLRIEERSYGFRLTSPRDSQGHGDVASAFSFACKKCVELVTKVRHKARVITGTMDGSKHFDSNEVAGDPVMMRQARARMSWCRGVHPTENVNFDILGD